MVTYCEGCLAQEHKVTLMFFHSFWFNIRHAIQNKLVQFNNGDYRVKYLL